MGRVGFAFTVSILAICSLGEGQQPCNVNTPCGFYEICNQGICKCQSSTTVHDSNQNVCLIKPGNQCHNRYGCVPNAFCRNDGSRYSFCECRDGFHPNPEGRCVHGYHETCMSNSDCDQMFDCNVIGRCVCPFVTEVFDTNKQLCVGTYGENCSDTCNSNFVCFHKKCICPHGLQLTLTKDRCMLGLGMKCDEKEHLCDSTRLLLCLQGKCRCQHPFQEYSTEKGMCIGLEGAHCNLSLIGNGNYHDNYFCTEGTNCQPLIGSSLIGICKQTPRYSGIIGKIAIVLVVFFGTGLLAFLLRSLWMYRQVTKKHNCSSLLLNIAIIIV